MIRKLQLNKLLGKIYTKAFFSTKDSKNSKTDIETKKKNEESLKIIHNYEKESLLPIKKRSSEEKEKMDKIVQQLIKEQGLSNEKIEEIKEKMKNPMSYTTAPNLFKVQTNEDLANLLNNFVDVMDNDAGLKNVDKLITFNKEINWRDDPDFHTVMKLDRLLKKEETPVEIDKNTNLSPNLNSPDYMKKQERYSVDYNYNFEQHREFSKRMKTQKKVDEEKILEEQKYLKYLKEHKDELRFKKHLIPKLPVPIEKIPDFEVDITGYKPKLNQKQRRKFDKRRHDIDITNYDAWRCYDRVIEELGANDGPSISVQLPPSLVIKAFGNPLKSEHIYYTGTYFFEDTNLDVFLLCDYKQTILYHGLNHTEEYMKEDNLKLHPKFRKVSHLEVGEFWSSEEPREFKIYFPGNSEARKFRVWLRKKIEDYRNKTVPSKLQELELKFGKIDDFSDYSIKRENDTSDIAINKYPPTYFDSKSKRVIEEYVRPVYIPPNEGEYFLMEEYMLQEAEKGFHREKQKLQDETLQAESDAQINKV